MEFVLERGVRIVRTTIKYPDLRTDIAVHVFSSMDDPDIIVLRVEENCMHYQSQNCYTLTEDWTIPEDYHCPEEYLDEIHPVLQELKKLNDSC